MNNPRAQIIGFFVFLALAGLVFIMIFWPYWELLALTGVLAVLFHPWYEKFFKLLKSESWAAFLATIFILVIVVGFLWLVGYVLLMEAGNVYTNFKTGSYFFDETAIISHLPTSLKPVAQNLLGNVYQRLSGLAGYALQNFSGLVSNIANFFLASFLVFFSLFYFLRDGEKIKSFFGQIFPLSEAHESVIIKKLTHAINGVLKGTFMVALMQGGVATVGFLVFGVPSPFLWGAFTVLSAFVPTVGTALSVMLAVLYLLLTGHTGPAIGMFIWYITLHAAVDNFVSPRIISHKTDMHPVLVLFAVLGGIQLFGFLGFLFGPVLVAVFLALLDIYNNDLKGRVSK